jgi:A118 family predicted phage portal protein
VLEWAQIEPVVSIENVDRPLFAYFKIPLANKTDRHSPLGASVFAEAAESIRDADEQYGRFLWEFEGGELAVDIDEDMLNHDLEGNVRMPKLQERLYRRRSPRPAQNGGSMRAVQTP